VEPFDSRPSRGHISEVFVAPRAYQQPGSLFLWLLLWVVGLSVFVAAVFTRLTPKTCDPLRSQNIWGGHQDEEQMKRIMDRYKKNEKAYWDDVLEFDLQDRIQERIEKEEEDQRELINHIHNGGPLNKHNLLVNPGSTPSSGMPAQDNDNDNDEREKETQAETKALEAPKLNVTAFAPRESSAARTVGMKTEARGVTHDHQHSEHRHSQSRVETSSSSESTCHSSRRKKRRRKKHHHHSRHHHRRKRNKGLDVASALNAHAF